jgi:hypothetical protein
LKALALRGGELLLCGVAGLAVLFSAARVGPLVAPPVEAAPASAVPEPSAAPSASEEPAPEPAASARSTTGPDAGLEEEDATCAIPDRGAGDYGPQHGLPLGTMIAPPVGEKYDLLVHFHGGGAVQRVVAPRKLGLVIATVDAGVGSRAYTEALYGPEPFQDLLAAVAAQLAPAVLRHVIVSSWSAGYGGVREILIQHPTVPSAVVLLDSVHAAYQPDGQSLVTAGLEPFVSLARRAVAGEAMMVLTHSEIRPPSFASTTELADYFLGELGARRSYAGLIPVHGVQYKTSFGDGALRIRGYTGKDKGAHCAHLMLLGEILEEDVLPFLKDR